jgi:transcriptional regulator with XRE-family HTH domain
VIFLLVNNADILKVLGKNIKKVRKEKGYTQDYVAEQINVSTDLLRSIENGRRRDEQIGIRIPISIKG